MDSVENTAVVEQAHSSIDFTPKKKPKKLGGIVKLGGSEKTRYRALRYLKIPSAEAVELSKKTFAELREMGYSFGSLPCKPGGKPVKQTGKKPKVIRGKLSRYDALKKIGVKSNLKELAKKSFAELKQMGFKFSSQKPVKQKQSFTRSTGYAAESPKAKEIPIQNPPKLSHAEIVPTQPQQETYSEGPVRVGIQDAKPMTDSELQTLSRSILENIAGMPRGQGPRFNGYSRKPGWLLITCVDQRSKNWLEELVPSLKPWPEASLKVIPESELRKPNIATLFIPNIDITMIEQSLSLIRAQNALHTELWKVVHSKPQKGGVIVTLSLDSESVDFLQKKDMKANLGFGEVQFRLKGLKAHKSGTDFPASNSLPDQSLPGTSRSDPNLNPVPNVLAPKRAIPCHSIEIPPETSKVCQVPESFSNRKGERDIHERYSSTESNRGREDIRGGSSYSGKEDISRDIDGGLPGGIRYSGRDDIKGDDSYCSSEVKGDLSGNVSCSRMEDMRGNFSRGSSYRGREVTGVCYSGREDVGEDIDSSYGSRENIKGGAGYSSDNNTSADFWYTRGREDVNKGARSRWKEATRGDNQSYICRGDIIKSASYTNYSGREDSRDNFYGGSSAIGRGDILKDSSYSGREDIEKSYPVRGSEDMHRGPSYRCREDINGVSSYSGTEYFNRDAGYSRDDKRDNFRNQDDPRGDQDMGYRGREAICYTNTDIRANHNQQQSKIVINDDRSGFKGGRLSRVNSTRTQLPSSPGFSRVRDIDIRRISGGTAAFELKDDSEIEIDRNRDIGGDMEEFSEGRGFGGKASHTISPSTGSYTNRNFGGDKRGINGGTSGFGGRKDSQIHQQFLPESRWDCQVPQTSSNWGNRDNDINSLGTGYTKGGQWYSASSVQGRTRGDSQRYTKGDN